MKHISTALNTESMVPIQMFFPVFSRRGLSFMKAVITVIGKDMVEKLGAIAVFVERLKGCDVL